VAGRARLRLVAGLLALSAAGGCGSGSPALGDLSIDCTSSPASPRAGSEARLEVRLSGRDGAPVTGARIRIEARMAHPGMAPIIADAVEETAGTYASRLTLSMAGDWIVTVAGELDDGRRVRQPAGTVTARAAAAD
jgi:hypothetical protein